MQPTADAREHRVNVRLSGETWQQLQAIAKADGRTPSGYVRWLLVQHLEERHVRALAAKAHHS